MICSTPTEGLKYKCFDWGSHKQHMYWKNSFDQRLVQEKKHISHEKLLEVPHFQVSDHNGPHVPLTISDWNILPANIVLALILNPLKRCLCDLQLFFFFNKWVVPACFCIKWRAQITAFQECKIIIDNMARSRCA